MAFMFLRETVKTYQERDPAARLTMEVIFCYPDVYIVIFDAPPHALWLENLYHLGRLFSYFSFWLIKIEIQLAAKLGCRRVIDHGMAVAVGETAKVLEPITAGNNARIGSSAVPVDPVASDATVVGILARPVNRKVPCHAAAVDPYGMPCDNSLAPRLRGRESLHAELADVEVRPERLTAGARSHNAIPNQPVAS